MSADKAGVGVLPAPPEKAAAVRRMFEAIAPRYDLLNHLLSANRDRTWRRRTVDVLLARGSRPAQVLDACTGTLDLALEVARRPEFRGRVVAADFALPMLERGRPKVGAAPVSLASADALRLPFGSGTFDGAVVGFGIRNLADLTEGLRELRRVLRTGSPLVILEFTVPERQPLRTLYLAYFRGVLPLVGRVVSRHDQAYSYLPASVLGYPGPADFADRMRDAGFDGVHWLTLSGGIVAIHSGLAA